MPWNGTPPIEYVNIIADGITSECLKSILQYEPSTGEFICIKKFCSKSVVGAKCGYWDKKTNRFHIRIGRRLYLAHRLAWLYMTGKWPEQEVDHRNGDASDNRWINLRAASRSQNQANVGPGIRNTSGFKGVHFVPKRNKWRSQIRLGNKRLNLGDFSTPEEAHATYTDAAAAYYGEFTYAHRRHHWNARA